MSVIPKQVRSYNDMTFRDSITLPAQQENLVDNLKQAREIARELSGSVFENLSEFPYIYFTEGVTGALNYLLPGAPIQIRQGEYRYSMGFPNVSFAPAQVGYYSYPFSSDGNYGNLEKICSGKDRVILDCSYAFASNLKSDKIIPGNVSHLAFGVSKSHNLYDLRVGWFFSRKKVITYHTLQYDYGYASAMYLPTLQAIAERPVNYLYLKYRDILSAVYSKNNLSEGDTNLFALDAAGNRIMHYEINI